MDLSIKLCVAFVRVEAGPPLHGDPAAEVRRRSLHRRRGGLPRSPPRHPLPAHGHRSVSHGEGTGGVAHFSLSVLNTLHVEGYVPLLSLLRLQDVDEPDANGQTPVMLAAQKIIG